MEHQENTSDGEDDEKEAGNASQTERIGEPEAMAFDFCRKDMEEEVVIDEHGPLQIGIRYSGSEDRTPDRRIRNTL
jgi:hypothetical protein